METLEHTANIVWKAIQLGNLGVLPEEERDRLMTLREKFAIPGRISSCDATPMPANHSAAPADATISEEDIREIAKRVISKLNQ
jgi:hypothetical protein